MKRRIVALVIALFMVLSVTPTGLAENEPHTHDHAEHDHDEEAI